MSKRIAVQETRSTHVPTHHENKNLTDAEYLQQVQAYLAVPVGDWEEESPTQMNTIRTLRRYVELEAANHG